MRVCIAQNMMTFLRRLMLSMQTMNFSRIFNGQINANFEIKSQMAKKVFYLKQSVNLNFRITFHSPLTRKKERNQEYFVRISSNDFILVSSVKQSSSIFSLYPKPSEMSEKMIKLKSSDGEVIETQMACALMSHTGKNFVVLCVVISVFLILLFCLHLSIVKDMLDAIGQEFDESTEVPIQNVSSQTLARVVQWMEHWKDEPQPSSKEIKDKLAENIDSWNEDFLKIELNELYDLVSRI